MPTIIPTTTDCRDWHCTRCFRLLGKRLGGRVHLRTTRGVEYIATLPTTATCRCGCMNELPAPSFG
jgi:hypothetical protein